MFQRVATVQADLVLLNVALIVVLGVAVPAAAQSVPKAEISIGYIILRDRDIYQETYPVGWNVDAAVPVIKTLKIVGEAGGAYRNLNLLGTSFDLGVRSLMGGSRVRPWQKGRMAFSAQLLAGFARLSARAAGETASSTIFALQPGAHVDVRLTDLVGIRIGGDYRRIQAEGPEFRFVAGAVFRAGKK